MRPVPARAGEFVGAFEGLRLESYQDAVGVWTVGYGSTAGVHAGMRITKTEARRRLNLDLNEARARLYGVVKPGVVEKLTEAQYVALLSFVFNLGANPKWTIWKLLNAGQFDAVPAQIQRFVNAGGRKLAGLVRRRAAEAALWNEDAEEDDAPSSFIREEETPPTPEPAKPLAKSRTFWGAGAVAVASAPEAIKNVSAGVGQVTGAVQPFAGKSKVVDGVLENLATVGAFLAFALVAFLWLKKKGWL